MKLSPKLTQAIEEILSEENFFDSAKLALIITGGKWSFEEFKLLSRMTTILHHKLIREIERKSKQQTTETICNFGNDNPRIDSEWDLSD